MPQAPDTYQPPHKKQTEDIKEHNSGKSGQQAGNGLYQTYRYQVYRSRQKKRQRRIDEDRVHDLYQELEQRSFKEYMRWLQSDNPLCVHCLEENKINAGRILDHIEPIEKGGAIYDTENQQWLCDHHHNIKRATEDKK